jgi:hypothetical protein
MVAGAISLLVVGIIGAWLQFQILNEDRFSQSVSDAATTESSRDAIASAVVDRILRNQPVALSIVGNPIEKAIAGLIGSDLFTQAISLLSRAVWREIFVRGGAGVTLDIAQAKTLLAGIFTLLNSTNASSVEPSTIPDSVTVIPSGQLPDLRWLDSVAPWVTLSAAIASVLILVLSFWKLRDREDRLRLISTAGVVLVLTAIGVFLLVIIARSTVLSDASTENGRTLLESFFREFLRPLYLLLVILALIGCVLFASKRWIAGASVPFERQPQTSPIEIADQPLAKPE